MSNKSWAYKLGWTARGAAHTVAMGPAAVVVGAAYAAQGTKYAAQQMAEGWKDRGAVLELETQPYMPADVSPEIKREAQAIVKTAEAKAQVAAAEVKIKARVAKKAAEGGTPQAA